MLVKGATGVNFKVCRSFSGLLHWIRSKVLSLKTVEIIASYMYMCYILKIIMNDWQVNHCTQTHTSTTIYTKYQNEYKQIWQVGRERLVSTSKNTNAANKDNFLDRSLCYELTNLLNKERLINTTITVNTLTLNHNYLHTGTNRFGRIGWGSKQ